MHSLLLAPLLQTLALAEPVSVLIMPVANKEGVSKDLAEQVTSVITHTASSFETFKVIAVAEVQGAMSQEQFKQLAGCDSVSCAAEIGGALNTEQVVIGSLGLVGDQYLLSLTRIRSKDATRVGSVLERIEAEPKSKLLDRITAVTPVLFGLAKAATPAPTAAAAAPPTTTTSKPPEEESSGFSPIKWIVRGIGVGGLVLAAPPLVTGMTMSLVVLMTLILDGGPSIPGQPRQHNITPVQAMFADASGMGSVVFGLLAVFGVTLSLALLGLSVVGPS